MVSTNYKKNIYLLGGVYIVACIILFSYGFGILHGGSAAAEIALKDQTRQYNDLQNEQRSFELGNKDLETLKSKPHQPDDFFSKDVRVVNEIKTLEALGAEYGLEFDLKVSGTAASGTKTPNVIGPILSIPYTISLTGTFPNIVAFLERMEQLEFITHVKAASLSSAGPNKVHAVLNALFYIKK